MMLTYGRLLHNSKHYVVGIGRVRTVYSRNACPVCRRFPKVTVTKP